MSSSSAAATPAPTASAPPCATAAGAWCNSRFCRSRRWSARADNPWPEWPKVYKLDYGQEEAAAKFGADPRVYLTTAKKFVGDANGRVKEIVTVQIKWERNEKGQFVPKEQPGTETGAPRAAGAAGDGLPRARTGAAQGDRRRVRRPQQRQGRITRSTRPTSQGVFAAGDCRRGQSLVVWAINEGRGAARECDRYLMGQTDLP